MGYDVMRNFRQPYLATSVADFWRRWHISLSTWFRDYLYIPMGGSRVSAKRRYFNIMVVFIVSGIWHGANMTYVLWGLLYGMYQVLGYILKPLKEYGYNMLRLNKKPGLYVFMCRAYTFILVSITWIIFRASSVSDALRDFGRMINEVHVGELFNGRLFQLGLGINNLLFVILSLVILILVDIMCEKKQCEVYELLNTTHVAVRWCIYYLLIIMVLLSCNLSTQEFLYQGF